MTPYKWLETKLYFPTKFSLRHRREETISRSELRMEVSIAPELNNSAIPSWCFHYYSLLFWRTLVKTALSYVTTPSGIIHVWDMWMTCRDSLHHPIWRLWLQGGEQLLPPMLPKCNSLIIPIITLTYILSSVIHISPELVKYSVFFISFRTYSFRN